MQLSAMHFFNCSPSSFNPHPSRRTGATAIMELIAKHGDLFQSSPVPEDGCNSFGLLHPPTQRRLFQSSPVPEDGCNDESARGKKLLPSEVSILTRPGGRVQLPSSGTPAPVRLVVSILTRPGGRVQLDLIVIDEAGEVDSFNPHPSRRTGAT